MKKICFTMVLVTGYTACIAQATNKLDSTGNVGIGTVTPAYKLEIKKSSTGSGLNLIGDAVGSRNDIGIDFSLANASTIPYARIGTQVTRATLGIETGGLTFSTIDYGVLSEKMFIQSDGNVGIGTASPAYKLEIKKSSTGSGLNLIGDAVGSRNDIGIDFSLANASTIPYARIGTQVTRGTQGIETGGLTFSTIDYGVLSEKMFIQSDGNVGIGTTNPLEKLSVDGNIMAHGTITGKKMVVSQNAWPDYVFQENYQLGNLTDLEAFIKKNRHLPEIPSAKEVEEKGISVGDNQALLLKKIEELTLYIIGLEKRMAVLENNNKQKRIVKRK